MKIAMVGAPTSLRVPDAAPRIPYLTALSGALGRAGHEVTIHVRRDDEALPDEETDDRGVHVIRLSAGPARQLAGATSKRVATAFAAALRDRLGADRPDVVHVVHSSVAPVAEDVVTRLGLPLVYSPDRGEPSKQAQIIATYTGQMDRLRAHGVAMSRISLIPRGVDVDHFTPDGPREIATAAHRIVAVGDLVPSSGFGTAVAALVALPEAELVIVGGPLRAAHARQLRDYASSLGVDGRVRLAGPVAHDKLPELLRSADLMVCSPWEPTFHVAALEAMACGVAVVANGLGGLADTVVDTVTGTHVSPRRPRDLAAALRELLAHKTTCEQLGASGRDRAWARYPWTQVAEETVHAYDRAIATR